METRIQMIFLLLLFGIPAKILEEITILLRCLTKTICLKDNITGLHM